jgi:hypothetical protein
MNISIKHLRVLRLVIISSALLFLSIPAFSQAAPVSSTLIIDLTNRERSALSLPALKHNPTLSQAAALKAKDMATRGYFSHNTPEGKTPWQFMTEAGYAYQSAGENLAVDFYDSEAAVRAWMNSPGHRANIVNNTYVEIGVAFERGVYQGRDTIFVVQMFGIPKVNTTTVNTNTPLSPDALTTNVVTPTVVTPVVVLEETAQPTVNTPAPVPQVQSNIDKPIIEAPKITEQGSNSELTEEPDAKEVLINTPTIVNSLPKVQRSIPKIASANESRKIEPVVVDMIEGENGGDENVYTRTTDPEQLREILTEETTKNKSFSDFLTSKLKNIIEEVSQSFGQLFKLLARI